jgi:hypothetical protein
MKKQGNIERACYKIIVLLFCLLPSVIFSQTGGRYSPAVTAVLTQTPKNRTELEKALNYFYATGDSLKIKAIQFLIVNMPIHSSMSYYWADSLNHPVSYNEEDFASKEKAANAFQLIEAKHGKLHPVQHVYQDIDSIKANMLIENVNLAVDKIRERGIEINKASEEIFLEYVLPYRTSIEPLQDWRKIYANRFGSLLTGSTLSDTQLSGFTQNMKTWFTNTYGVEVRKSPLPRLGALQLLSTAKGPCEDIADLTAFIARSNGYPAAVDFIPAWATASGMHFLNYLSPLPGNKTHFDAADGVIVDSLSREPAKVLRTTYSRQRNTIASLLKDSALIPEGFLRLQNYKDVTAEYWQTADVHAQLFKLRDKSINASFICVWNAANWRPVWYGFTKSNGTATYTNMCKGAVYLPMYYIDRKFIPAAWPVVNGYDTATMVLQPDTLHKRTVVIEEQARYLSFRAGKQYTLFYWNYRWVPLGTKKADATFSKLSYDNVPSNALLLLVPEYSQGKERPFIIDANGKRIWY